MWSQALRQRCLDPFVHRPSVKCQASSKRNLPPLRPVLNVPRLIDWRLTKTPNDPGASTAADNTHYLQAHKSGQLSFGFSAGGLLFPYFLGVISELEELGIVTESTHLAGASAGSLIVACHRSGLDRNTILNACLELAKDCREFGTRTRLRAVLEGTLTALLPEDVHERCEGRTHVAVTRVSPVFSGELLSSFHSREDLIEALLTSCHIPWYFNGSLVNRFRGEYCFDGGVTNFIPAPPVGTPAKVTCFPAKQLQSTFGKVAISPDAFEDWPYTVREMLSMALEPADDVTLNALMEKGKRDALTWAKEHGILAAHGSQAEASAVDLLVQPPLAA